MGYDIGIDRWMHNENILEHYFHISPPKAVRGTRPFANSRIYAKEAFRGSGVVEIHIPDGVEEFCDWCFCECENLSRVTFGESSSLKLIGKGTFFGSRVVEIHVPDGIERVLMDSDTSLSSQCRIKKLA